MKTQDRTTKKNPNNTRSTTGHGTGKAGTKTANTRGKENVAPRQPKVAAKTRSATNKKPAAKKRSSTNSRHNSTEALVLLERTKRADAESAKRAELEATKKATKDRHDKILRDYEETDTKLNGEGGWISTLKESTRLANLAQMPGSSASAVSQPSYFFNEVSTPSKDAVKAALELAGQDRRAVISHEISGYNFNNFLAEVIERKTMLDNALKANPRGGDREEKQKQLAATRRLEVILNTWKSHGGLAHYPSLALVERFRLLKIQENRLNACIRLSEGTQDKAELLTQLQAVRKQQGDVIVAISRRLEMASKKEDPSFGDPVAYLNEVVKESGISSTQSSAQKWRDLWDTNDITQARHDITPEIFSDFQKIILNFGNATQKERLAKSYWNQQREVAIVPVQVKGERLALSGFGRLSRFFAKQILARSAPKILILNSNFLMLHNSLQNDFRRPGREADTALLALEKFAASVTDVAQIVNQRESGWRSVWPFRLFVPKTTIRNLVIGTAQTQLTQNFSIFATNLNAGFTTRLNYINRAITNFDPQQSEVPETILLRPEEATKLAAYQTRLKAIAEATSNPQIKKQIVDQVKDISETQEKLTIASEQYEAMHNFAQGREDFQEGKFDEAKQALEKAKQALEKFEFFFSAWRLEKDEIKIDAKIQANIKANGMRMKADDMLNLIYAEEKYEKHFVSPSDFPRDGTFFSPIKFEHRDAYIKYQALQYQKAQGLSGDEKKAAILRADACANRLVEFINKIAEHETRAQHKIAWINTRLEQLPVIYWAKQYGISDTVVLAGLNKAEEDEKVSLLNELLELLNHLPKGSVLVNKHMATLKESCALDFDKILPENLLTYATKLNDFYTPTEEEGKRKTLTAKVGEAVEKIKGQSTEQKKRSDEFAAERALAHYAKAYALHKLGKSNAASQAFEEGKKLLAQASNAAEGSSVIVPAKLEANVLYLQAKYYSENQQDAKALECITDARKLVNSSTDKKDLYFLLAELQTTILYEQARQLIEQGQYSLAEEKFGEVTAVARSVASQFPDLYTQIASKVLLLRGDIECAQGNREAAKENYKLADASEEAEWRLDALEALNKNTDKSEVEKNLALLKKRLVDLPNSLEFLQGKFNLEKQLGKWKEALITLRELTIKVGEQKLELNLLQEKGECLIQYSLNNEEEMTSLSDLRVIQKIAEEVSAQSSKNATNTHRLFALYANGYALYKMGEYAKAEQCFQAGNQALSALNPDSKTNLAPGVKANLNNLYYKFVCMRVENRLASEKASKELVLQLERVLDTADSQLPKSFASQLKELRAKVWYKNAEQPKESILTTGKGLVLGFGKKVVEQIEVRQGRSPVPEGAESLQSSSHTTPTLRSTTLN